MAYVEIALAPNPKPIWKGELALPDNDPQSALDAVFAIFNERHPVSYGSNRSLSVGDEVFLATPQLAATFRCTSHGWESVN